MPTIGVVRVAFLAATSAGVVQVKSTSIFRPRSLQEGRDARSERSDIRCSMTMVWPSTYPWSRKPCRNVSVSGTNPSRGDRHPDPIYLPRPLRSSSARRGERTGQRGQQEAATVHYSIT